MNTCKGLLPALFLLAGCAPAPQPPAVATIEESRIAQVAVSAPIDVNGTLRSLHDDLDEIEQATGTELGIALYDGHINGHTGSVATLPSWSTVKVPIALASLEHCSYSDAAISSMIEASIEWSDNDSARALLSCVGTEKVAEEVAEAGASIEVSPAFGRSEWPLASAARYGWYLSTLDEDNEVIVAMNNIVEEQRWGLGNVEGAVFKGGWSGDRLDGSWHSRQMGFVRVGHRVVGVAIASRSPAGSYADTIDALDQVAVALGEELGVGIHPR